MHADVPLIATLAVALGMALLFGLVAVQLKLPALVGYLLAGVLLGPFTPGYVADAKLAAELAEIGVMLLMFGVGLHFSVDDLLAVRHIAIPGAIAQIAAATALGYAVASLWGWAPGGALVFGLCLSVASTVVLLRALESSGTLRTRNGAIAVGWLVVEDLVMVLVLVLLPPLAGWLGGTPMSTEVIDPWVELGLTLTKVALFIGLMLVLGRRLFPRLLVIIANTGSRELFTLCVIAAAVSIAFAAGKLFGVSFALGAFFAGMVLRESQFSHRAAEESLPLREAFAVLFFVSVGMLFDPRVLLDQPVKVLAVVGIIVVGKSLASVALVLAMRYPLNTALTVSASLAQIGEFSFILAGLGMSLGLLPPSGQSLILAGALISITINPLVFKAMAPLQAWLLTNSALARRMNQGSDPLAALPHSTMTHLLNGQVVLVGLGQIGSTVAEALSAQGIPFVAAERSREKVEAVRARGWAAVSGEATEPEVLVQAHIAHAGMLVICIRDDFAANQMARIARALNPSIEIIVCAENANVASLMELGERALRITPDEAVARTVQRAVIRRYRE